MKLLFSTLMNKAYLGMFYNVSYIPGLFSVPYIRPQGYQFLLHYLLGPCPSPNFLEATFCAASLNRPGAFSRLKRILQSRYITGLSVCFCWNFQETNQLLSLFQELNLDGRDGRGGDSGGYEMGVLVIFFTEKTIMATN